MLGDQLVVQQHAVNMLAGDCVGQQGDSLDGNRLPWQGHQAPLLSHHFVTVQRQPSCNVIDSNPTQ